ncbi:hypothetical protein [Nocardia asiatica]|uniref:hypothetical protein n=1 Tax=Nocardia asiatica TaxID=209252 RepID=UPI003EE238A9
MVVRWLLVGGASGVLMSHLVRGVVHGALAGVVWCAPLSLPVRCVVRTLSPLVHTVSLDVSRLVGSVATPVDECWPVVSLVANV